MTTAFLHALQERGRYSLAYSSYLRDFEPTRDRTIASGSLFTFKDLIAAPVVWPATPRKVALKRYMATAFGEVDFIGDLNNERGVCVRLRCPSDATCSAAATFLKQILVLKKVLSDESTLVIHLMTPSGADHENVRQELQVGRLLEFTASFQRLDLPVAGAELDERCYSILAARFRVMQADAIPRKQEPYLCDVLMKLAGTAAGTAFLVNPTQPNVSEEEHANARWVNSLCVARGFELHLVSSASIGNSFIYKKAGTDRPTCAFVHGEVVAIESKTLGLGDSLSSPTEIYSIRVLDRATPKTHLHFARDVETLVDVMVSEYSDRTVIAHEWAAPGPDGDFSTGVIKIQCGTVTTMNISPRIGSQIIADVTFHRSDVYRSGTSTKTYGIMAYALEVIHPSFLRAIGVVSSDQVDDLIGEVLGLVV
ncbi:hypothetical protein DFH09DRAFT_1364768 [Mycena vulgaris]|nr:hypothetical protein DFH09DRAFT_1364768 [Mycena vulgaris]